jgi:hypothetical protein
MKYYILIAIFLASSSVLADDSPSLVGTNSQSIDKALTCSQESQLSSQQSPQSNCAGNNVSLLALNVKDQPQQSGCCSWHGGECGCSMGQVVCCDNTVSPSCRC